VRVIRSFADQGTEDIFDRRDSPRARRRCPRRLWSVAQRKLDMLNAVVSLESLRVPPGNALEALRRDRQGQHSIRINDQFRLCFVWTADGPEQVEIADCH
jgi:proteic killer suppression protein